MNIEIEIPNEVILEKFKDAGERELLSLVLKIFGQRGDTWSKHIAVIDEGEIYLVAEGLGPWGADAPLCQFGVCACSQKVVSWAKNAECPVCGRGVFLT